VINMEDIKVYELFRTDLRGAVVIDGFPSVGLVSTICANYLISSLNLKQIGIMDSIYFPTVSVVRESEPLNPVRIYGGDILDKNDENKSIVVFISEFQPPPKLIKLIAGTILDWVIEQNCEFLVSPEGLVIERGVETETAPEKGLMDKEDLIREVIAKGQDESSPSSGGKEEEMRVATLNIAMDLIHASTGEDPGVQGETEGKETIPVEDEEAESGQGGMGEEPARQTLDIYGIASTTEARELLEGTRIMPFSEGVISGVAGVLLNEGKRRDFNVISLLAETRTEYPDARAAARVIEAIDETILNIGIDVGPLYKEAEGIELKIKMMRAQMNASKRIKHTSPSMYG